MARKISCFLFAVVFFLGIGAYYFSHDYSLSYSSPARKTIYHFWPSGNNRMLNQPLDVAKTGNDLYWIAESTNQRLSAVNNNGTIVKVINLEGNFAPGSIWWQNNHLYVCDLNSNQILILDKNGNLINRLFLSTNGAIVKPVFITGDNQERLFVADVFYHQVIVLDNLGNIIQKIAKPGHEKGQVYYPYGIAYDQGNKRIYVSDFGNQEVDIFDINGSWLGDIPTLRGKQIRGLAWDERRDLLWAVDIFNHSVLILNKEYKIVEQINELSTGQFLYFPNSVRVFGNEVLIADKENNRIVQRIEVDRK
ncbi:hypothetical protein [Carboxydocella sp. ULO1]|uniref:hypothetical protein n=1 Tax=Carboxydocella sp. ULO1 TaxID=1926599 RepID=UPI0009C4D16A|nr:hypothetical protein [Carboxydocella sp. ULO1]GAW29658.1 hypothetical protein ULO1_22280 [Carboxydocella sp. ULO1]